MAGINDLRGVNPITATGNSAHTVQVAVSPATDSGGNEARLAVDSAGNLLTAIATSKSLRSIAFSISSNTQLVALVAAKRVKVCAVAFTTPSTSAVSPILTDGNGGATIWEIGLQAITGSVSGVSQGISPPGFICATTAGNALYMNPQGATCTGVITYHQDDAS